MKLLNFKLPKNPLLLFLPFLLLYVVIILIFAVPGNFGDENRYLNYAVNLTHGFYTHPAPYLDLGNGPGYSIILVPFVALKFPVISIKLLNAVFYYFSIILLFKSLQKFVTFKFAIIVSVIWALYPNTFEQLPYALPEIFASSLIPLLIFCFTSTFDEDIDKKCSRNMMVAGLTLGYLALTKPIFGYVITFMILGATILLLVNRTNSHYKKSIMILTIAFITTIPWLTYTYDMTGKVFYWSSYGGNNLYWMSSPYANEYGDWMFDSYDNIDSTNMIPGSIEEIKLKHQKDFEEILASEKAQKLYFKDGEVNGSPFAGVIQDDVLKRIALENIKNHPFKFIQNCISNVGRMIFNYPASYTIQKPSTLKRIPVNGIIVISSVFCLIITLINWERIKFAIRFLLLFGFIYFGGSVLGSAEPRMFTVVVPILLVWIAYVMQRTVKIELKLTAESS